jgi:hypothetical protein
MSETLWNVESGIHNYFHDRSNVSPNTQPPDVSAGGVILASGQSYEIRHPEMAMLRRRSLLVGTDPADDGIPGEFKIFSLPHVTSIEPITQQAA